MSQAPPKIIVVMPTYNERENVRQMAAALFDLDLPNFQLLIVDDNSPDGTGRIADELARAPRYAGRLSVLHRPRKQGLGPAYRQGLQHALALGADLLVEMDADFSHQPKYLPRLLEAARDHDLALGSRYVAHGSVDEAWGPLRKLLSSWANRVFLPITLNVPIKDATGGYRVYRRDCLLGMNIDRLRSNGYVFQVEMIYVAQRLGYRIKEVPIHFPDRARGKTKMSLGIALEAVLRVFQIRYRHRDLKPARR